MNAFVDNSREIIDITNDTHWSPEEIIEYHVNSLKNLGRDYSRSINMIVF
jgi:hypothetical protein